MEKFVLMLMLMNDPVSHALGPFQSHDSCVGWMTLLNQTGIEFIGTCVTMREFRRERPHMVIEDLGT